MDERSEFRLRHFKEKQSKPPWTHARGAGCSPVSLLSESRSFSFGEPGGRAGRCPLQRGSPHCPAVRPIRGAAGGGGLGPVCLADWRVLGPVWSWLPGAPLRRCSGATPACPQTGQWQVLPRRRPQSQVERWQPRHDDQRPFSSKPSSQGPRLLSATAREGPQVRAWSLLCPRSVRSGGAGPPPWLRGGGRGVMGVWGQALGRSASLPVTLGQGWRRGMGV